MCTLLVLAGMQFVKRFQRFERVLIHGVVMIEIVLDEQSDAAKLRHKTSEKADLMHQPQHVTAAPAPTQKVHEGPRSFSGKTEVTIHCRQTLPHGIAQRLV